MMLDYLDFHEVEAQHPQRYEKIDLLQASITPDETGFIVKREPGDCDAHVCQLVIVDEQPFGDCGCQWFNYNDTPCAHLCALWRAYQREWLDLPRGRPAKVDVTIIDDEQARADANDTLPIASDGGWER